MKLYNLRRVSDYEINMWLIKELELTPYQEESLKRNEIVRSSDFYFYEEPDKIKTNLLWRLSIIPFLIWLLLLLIGMPIKWLFTGDGYYGNRFLDKYFSSWRKKTGWR